MGWFSNIWSKAKNFASNVYNKGRSFLTGGSNYIGPFNPLNSDYLKSHPPTDAVDAGAMNHDLDYSRIAKQRDTGNVSALEANKLIRESDERFLQNTRDNLSSNYVGGGLGWLGIKAKNLAEDYLGLDPNKFVTQRRGGLVDRGLVAHHAGKIIHNVRHQFGYDEQGNEVRYSNIDTLKGIYALSPVEHNDKDNKYTVESTVIAKIGLGGLTDNTGGLLRRVKSYYTAWPRGAYQFAYLILKKEPKNVHHTVFLKQLETRVFELLDAKHLRYNTGYHTHVRGGPEWFKARIREIRNAFKAVKLEYPDNVDLLFPAED